MSKQYYSDQTVSDALETNYMPYAMSVIVSRAIPEIDGFKPSHRKLLYTMYKMGLLTGDKTKSANVVGQTMKLNPHGDMAIYETLVRLTRDNGSLLHPYVDSKGNFGMHQSRDMAFAASRYTNVKLDPICAELFGDIDKNTVEFVDNYDGMLKEPTLLPAAFPSILVNANQGIAVGMASNICSFNLGEVCEAEIAYLRNENADLLTVLRAPDFSTGGKLIWREDEMRSVFETGRGSVRVRAVYQYDKKNHCLEITEIPYTTTVEAIIDKIIELAKQGKLREVADIRDETDKQGLKIAIDLKRGTDPDKLMTKLYKLTPLEDVFGCNFNVLIDGSPRVMGVREILAEWTRFRIGCVRKSLNYDLDKKNHRLHLLTGLEKILVDIDKAIHIIRNTEEEVQVVPNLMDGFGIDMIQAEFIAEIKLRHLNREYILNRLSDIKDIKAEIAEITKTLSGDLLIKKKIIAELQDIIKKFARPRKTEIVPAEEIEDYVAEETVENYKLKMYLTEQNYIKKVSLVSLRASNAHKLKEDDRFVCETECENVDEVLFFSNCANVYKMKVKDLPDCKASALGEYLPNILGISDEEKILYMVVTANFAGNMLFCFANGKMAKVPLACYETKTNRKKLARAYCDKFPVVAIRYLAEDTDLLAFNSINKILLFSTEKVPLKTTRTTQGVQVMTQNKDTTLTRVCAVEDVTFQDVSVYRSKNIPARGSFIKDEDLAGGQVTLL